VADSTRSSASPQTPAVTLSFHPFLRRSRRSGGHHEAISLSTNTSCYVILLSISVAVASEWRIPRGHQPRHKHQLLCHLLSTSAVVASEWWTPRGHQPLPKHQLLPHPFIHFCGSRAGVAGTMRPPVTPQTPAHT